MCNCNTTGSSSPGSGYGTKTVNYNQTTREIESVVLNFMQVVPRTDMIADGMTVVKHATKNRVIITLKTTANTDAYKMDAPTYLSYTHKLTASQWDALETDDNTLFEIVTDWCRNVSIDDNGAPMFDEQSNPEFNNEPAERPEERCFWIFKCWPAGPSGWPPENCFWQRVCVKNKVVRDWSKTEPAQ